MARAVLLGHSGFLGRAVQGRLVEQGVAVQGLSSAEIDLRRPECLAALDAVLGEEDALWVLAALTPDKGNDVDTFAANVGMAINVARYLETHRVRLCVYVSSDAVYPFGSGPVTEDSPVLATNLYAASKYASERVLSCVAEAKRIPLLVLRPTGVFGPGDAHGSYGPNVFTRLAAKSGTVKVFGEGEELRDHVYVDDAARIFVALAAGGHTGTFNVATGASRTFASVVEMLGALTPITVERAPRKASITHRRFDIAKLRGALPDVYFTPFAEALRLTLDAARAASP